MTNDGDVTALHWKHVLLVSLESTCRSLRQSDDWKMNDKTMAIKGFFSGVQRWQRFSSEYCNELQYGSKLYPVYTMKRRARVF